MADKIKQNILVLIADQQNRQSVYGSECRTPNLDALMDEAVAFSRAYTVNPICSPSRASLMTGMLPHRHGMVDCTHTVEPFRARFQTDLETFPQILASEEYTLSYFGKWHVERSERLEDFGFHEYETEGTSTHSFPQTLMQQLSINQDGYNDRTIAGVQREGAHQTEEHHLYSRAIDFVTRQAESSSPWCTFVSTYSPHDPYIVPREIYETYDPQTLPLPANFRDDLQGRPGLYRRLQGVWDKLSDDDYREILACYYGACTLVDRQVGRIMDTLRKTGQLENTIVVYMSDHGDLMGAHRLLCKGIPPFEEIYNIPLVMRIPSRTHRGRQVCGEYVSTIDVAPTLLDLAGSRGFDDVHGESVAAYLDREEGSPQRSAYAEIYGQRFAYTQRIVWKNDHKYVFNTFDFDELYDLAEDPGETRNLVDDAAYKEVLVDLCREMWNIAGRTGDDCFLDSEYVMFRFAPIGPERDRSHNRYNRVP